MTSTGRHLDETQAGIPNAPNERADLYGRSHCERHQGQLPKGRTQRPDIWAHRSRMRSAKEKRALDRGVVPHMGIPPLQESAKVVLARVHNEVHDRAASATVSSRAAPFS